MLKLQCVKAKLTCNERGLQNVNIWLLYIMKRKAYILENNINTYKMKACI